MKSTGVFALGLVAVIGAGCVTQDDPVEAFLGAWSVTGGTVTVACDSGSRVDTLEGKVTFERGSTSDLVLVLDDASCSLRLDVSGTSASLQPDQTCTENTTRGRVEIAWKMWDLDISDDHHGGWKGSLNANVKSTVFDSGLTYGCTTTETATLTKLTR